MSHCESSDSIGVPQEERDRYRQITREADIAPLAGRITVLHVTDFGENWFIDDTGSELYPTYTRDDARERFDDLGIVFEAFGPGVHAEREVFPLLADIFKFNGLAAAMPEMVFRKYFTTDTYMRCVRIGNIALVSRDATHDELEARRAQREQAEQAKTQTGRMGKDAQRVAEERARQEKLRTLDHGKTPLARFDHAIITVEGHKEFYLTPDRADKILAGRIIQTLRRLGPAKGIEIEGQAIIDAAWAMMTRSERELFISGGTEINRIKEVIKARGKVAISKYALSILRYLTNAMGITFESSGDKFRIERPVSIRFTTLPLAEDTDLATLTPIFPPGTPPENRTWGTTGRPIPMEAMAKAVRLLDHEVTSTVRLGQDVAIVLFNDVTNREVKRAIRAELASRNDPRNLDMVLEQLRGRISDSLREGFGGAWRKRMIGGDTTGGSFGRIQQISGGLRASMTKWHLGVVPEDGSSPRRGRPLRRW